MQLRTAGDLRGFLAEVLVGIKNGDVDANQAGAISKVAAQINASLATEVQARMHLKGLDGEAAGGMVIGSLAADSPAAEPLQKPQQLPAAPSEQFAEAAKISAPRHTPKRGEGEKIWCEQCDMSVTVAQAVGCKSAFCKAKDTPW